MVKSTSQRRQPLAQHPQPAARERFSHPARFPSFLLLRSQFEQKAILKPADLPCQLGRIQLLILSGQVPLDLACHLRGLADPPVGSFRHIILFPDPRPSTLLGHHLHDRLEKVDLQSQPIVQLVHQLQFSLSLVASITVILLVTVGIWMYYTQVFSVSTNSGRTVLPQTIINSPPVVTKAEYDRIAEGMTYEQVRGIIGATGEELARNNIAGIETVMYSWMNSNGSNMNAMFQNGKLMQKAQFGLP